MCFFVHITNIIKLKLKIVQNNVLNNVLMNMHKNMTNYSVINNATLLFKI